MPILFKHSRDCCGCLACVDACPKGCISIKRAEGGVLYPSFDPQSCINCNLCLKVCPIKNADLVKNPVTDDRASALVANDPSLLRKSASGGAFSFIMDAFVKKCQGEPYAIVGAAFDGLKVIHTSRETRQEADIFRKSKYIQSNTEGIFKKVKADLNAGKWVLFSGTPCIVAALISFLGKTYERLVTVDLLCHGVPSQELFDAYLKEVSTQYNDAVSKFEFRHKTNFDEASADARNILIEFESGAQIALNKIGSKFLTGYYQGLFYRESCYHCKFASPRRVGDITIGDFWINRKVAKEYNPHRGLSLLRANNAVGRDIVATIAENDECRMFETSYRYACWLYPTFYLSTIGHVNRRKFWFLYTKKRLSFCESVSLCQRKALKEQFLNAPHRFHAKIKNACCKLTFKFMPRSLYFWVVNRFL